MMSTVSDQYNVVPIKQEEDDDDDAQPQQHQQEPSTDDDDEQPWKNFVVPIKQEDQEDDDEQPSKQKQQGSSQDDDGEQQWTNFAVQKTTTTGRHNQQKVEYKGDDPFLEEGGKEQHVQQQDKDLETIWTKEEDFALIKAVRNNGHLLFRSSQNKKTTNKKRHYNRYVILDDDDVDNSEEEEKEEDPWWIVANEMFMKPAVMMWPHHNQAKTNGFAAAAAARVTNGGKKILLRTSVVAKTAQQCRNRWMEMLERMMRKELDRNDEDDRTQYLLREQERNLRIEFERSSKEQEKSLRCEFESMFKEGEKNLREEYEERTQKLLREQKKNLRTEFEFLFQKQERTLRDEYEKRAKKMVIEQESNLRCEFERYVKEQETDFQIKMEEIRWRQNVVMDNLRTEHSTLFAQPALTQLVANIETFAAMRNDEERRSDPPKIGQRSLSRGNDEMALLFQHKGTSRETAMGAQSSSSSPKLGEGTKRNFNNDKKLSSIVECLRKSPRNRINNNSNDDEPALFASKTSSRVSPDRQQDEAVEVVDLCASSTPTTLHNKIAVGPCTSSPTTSRTGDPCITSNDENTCSNTKSKSEVAEASVAALPPLSASETYSKRCIFPFKLYSMLEYAERNGIDVISWIEPNGESLVIRDQKRFEKEMIPLWFDHSNIRLFVKQMYYWDFVRAKVRLPSDNYNIHWRHPNFQRNRPDLLMLIKYEKVRKKGETSKRTASSSVPMQLPLRKRSRNSKSCQPAANDALTQLVANIGTFAAMPDNEELRSDPPKIFTSNDENTCNNMSSKEETEASVAFPPPASKSGACSKRNPCPNKVYDMLSYAQRNKTDVMKSLAMLEDDAKDFLLKCQGSFDDWFRLFQRVRISYDELSTSESKKALSIAEVRFISAGLVKQCSHAAKTASPSVPMKPSLRKPTRKINSEPVTGCFKGDTHPTTLHQEVIDLCMLNTLYHEAVDLGTQMTHLNGETPAYLFTPTPKPEPSSLTCDVQQKWTKEMYIVFIGVLVKYLEHTDKNLHNCAMFTIRDCSQQNKSGGSGYESITESTKQRLFLVVGAKIWKRVADYSIHIIDEKKKLDEKEEQKRKFSKEVEQENVKQHVEISEVELEERKKKTNIKEEEESEQHEECGDEGIIVDENTEEEEHEDEQHEESEDELIF